MNQSTDPTRSDGAATEADQDGPTICRAAFVFDDVSEEVYDAAVDRPPLSRVSISKTYDGEIVGTGTATVLTARGDGGAGYVASERIVGTVQGRGGSFVIQHGGVDDAGTLSTFGGIVPGSGTDQLVGLTGRAFEDEQGVLTLEYEIPAT